MYCWARWICIQTKHSRRTDSLLLLLVEATYRLSFIGYFVFVLRLFTSNSSSFINKFKNQRAVNGDNNFGCHVHFDNSSRWFLRAVALPGGSLSSSCRQNILRSSSITCTQHVCNKRALGGSRPFGELLDVNRNRFSRGFQNNNNNNFGYSNVLRSGCRT
jgi:hypothetical protein